MKSFTIYFFVLSIYHLLSICDRIVSVASEGSSQSPIDQFIQMIKTHSQEFFVARLTPYKKPDFVFCGVRTHTEKCGAVNLTLKFKKDNSISIETKAYVREGYFVVYKGKLFINEDALEKSIDTVQRVSRNDKVGGMLPVPQSMKEAVEFWVLFAKQVVEFKQAENPPFQKTFNQKCKDLGIPHLKNIETNFPDGTHFIFGAQSTKNVLLY